MNRNELAVRLAALPLVCWVGIAAVVAQGPISATLVSNDIAYAEMRNQTNGECASQIFPPGPFTSMSLSVPRIHYSCHLTQVGSDWHLFATSGDNAYQAYPNATDHADLTLTLTAPQGTIAMIDLQVGQGGDAPSPSGFRVDWGNDGTVEVESTCLTCTYLTHIRTWTWDFSNGDLAIRIRTDQVSIAGVQGYQCELNVRPWGAGATPIAPDCGGLINYQPGGSGSGLVSTNYQIAALPPTQAVALATLRANGGGQFGAFLVSDSQVTQPLTLPSPFTATCSVLAAPLFFDLGTVTATFSSWTSAPPRQWDLVVPQLPPGITFYVQHASALPIAPFPFGSSNVLRIDT